MCYSNSEEQHRWKCVSLIQRSSIAGCVLIKYRGAALLEVCYSNTEEQYRWGCYSNTEEQSAESVLFYFRVEVALEVC